MEGENHALMYEFPEYKDKIHDLKMSDKHFGNMVDEYHSLDHKIRGLESAKIPTDDANFNNLRMRRVQLKDQIFQYISK